MLTALAEHIGPGDRAVDLGTGSGILAIAAARLGADVIGIDLDPAAAPAAQTNAMANGVRERADVRIGDISDIGNDEPFDVALLNVTIDIHESVAPAVQRLDVPVLIVAGILDGEQAERAARLTAGASHRATERGRLGRPRVRSWTRQRDLGSPDGSHRCSRRLRTGARAPADDAARRRHGHGCLFGGDLREDVASASGSGGGALRIAAANGCPVCLNTRSAHATEDGFDEATVEAVVACDLGGVHTLGDLDERNGSPASSPTASRRIITDSTTRSWRTFATTSPTSR